MEKLEKIWHRVLSYWRKKSFGWQIACFSGALLLIVCLYVLGALLSINKSELVLARLHASVGGACHEECRLVRAAWRAELIKILKAGDRKLEKKIVGYFLDSGESLEFQEELARLTSEIYQTDDLPPYLRNYQENTDISPELKVIIFNYFFAKLEVQLADVEYYFTLLGGSADSELKQAAVRAIGNINEPALHFTSAQLGIIQSLLQSEELDEPLRQSLVMLLGDYYLFFPEETSRLLLLVYNSSTVDKISQFLAADILNRYRLADELPWPEVSDTAWEAYYLN